MAIFYRGRYLLHIIIFLNEMLVRSALEKVSKKLWLQFYIKLSALAARVRWPHGSSMRSRSLD
ncbi:hypothetical protein, partial [Pseudomonas savastanoi]